jgi:Vitamin K-dependent gamma-carboxylase
MKIISRHYNLFHPKYWFGQVDARPLGIFRIFFAGLMLKMVFYLLFVAEEFFSDKGVAPRSAILEIARANRYSLMDMLSQTWMAQIFFGIWILVLVCLLFGYRTRSMLVLNFIFIISAHARNFLILNGADLAFRVLSFWIMFIPLGATYSIDALHRRWQLFRMTGNHADLHPDTAPATIFALPVRLIQIQIALVYIFTFLLKLSGKPWHDGTALFYALQVESLTLPTGSWLLANAPLWLLQIGTYFSMVMEGSFVFLMFLPILQPRLRSIGLLMGCMMHLGIAVLLSIHDFSLVMMISYITFWDAAWIDTLTRKLQLMGLYIPQLTTNSRLWLPITRLYRKSSSAQFAPWLLKLGRISLSSGLIAAMCIVIWSNLSTIKHKDETIVPQITGVPRLFLQYSGMGQSWGMFAPYPSENNGWITIPGQFEDGLEIDLMTGYPLSTTITHYHWGPAVRWKKYSEEIRGSSSGHMLRAWGAYYCQEYNTEGNLPAGQRLATLNIVYNWRWSHTPTTEPNDLIHTELWHHDCLSQE